MYNLRIFSRYRPLTTEKKVALIHGNLAVGKGHRFQDTTSVNIKVALAQHCHSINQNIMMIRNSMCCKS